MHLAPGSTTHRLIGLFMAVLMPLCCCSTQVLGEVMLDDTSPMTRIGSCCSGFADADTSDCDEPSGTHDRCDCVRGHLDGGIDTTSVIETLACPSVAHPSVETNPLWEVDPESDLQPYARAR